MKRFFFLSFLLCALSLSTFTARANDYLEVGRHYSVYVAGQNCIHFKIPVWAYGRWNDYFNNDSSYVYLQMEQKNDKNETVYGSETRLVWFCGDSTGENEAGNGKGSGWVKVIAGKGNIVITNTYTGVRQQVDDTEKWVRFHVVQKEDDDCKRATILEFDWYPPVELNGKNFRLGIVADIWKKTGTERYMWERFVFNGPFSGNENLQTPQLYTPYLYTVNESGVAGYGMAAVPYMTFQTPLSYTVNYAGGGEQGQISDRSGTFYVPTADTVQYDVNATFELYRDEALGTTTTLTTPSVDIPAYHRIHNLTVKEERDATGSLTGSNIVSWEIHSPTAKDLVDGDYIEVQRAYSSDFSDARSVAVMPMRRDTQGIYTFVDDARNLSDAARTATMQNDTIERHATVENKGYILRDAEGNPLYSMNLKLTADKYVMPSAPVYYRVRRASSAMWGWEHEFARADTLYKHNYLAPLAKTQPDYTLDPDFATNRTVHFRFNIDNADIQPLPVNKEECSLSYKFVECKKQIDTVKMHVYVAQEIINAVYSIAFMTTGPYTYQRLKAGDNTVKVPMRWDSNAFRFDVKLKSDTYYFDGDVFNFYKTYSIYDTSADKWNRTTIYIDLVRSWQRKQDKKWCYECTISSKEAPASTGVLGEAGDRWEEVKEQVKEELYAELSSNNEMEPYGKCLWDRGARLILRRTSVENGFTAETVVPQDSIRRNEDGSWTAHVTDVASAACTHFEYEVLVDPTDAVLRFQDSVSLRPVRIGGPELYYDEAATVTSFTASQGATESNFKSGIRLQWQTSSASVDDFVLLRLVKGSSASPDTVYTGTDYSFFDETAVPDEHYEYTIVARYECNGKHTDNSASAEGWRTRYAQIGGTVYMPDNSGMAGVTVTLSVDGQTLRTMTTGASGAFLFDSLEYNLSAGTVYTIAPTSQYGTFSYNNTSSGVAVVAVGKDKAVVNGIAFTNTSVARLTGRVLYNMSTIPVADACFVLNGDTVRRNGVVYQTGTDGNFELPLPLSMPCRLQVAKNGHSFLNDGWLIVSGTDTAFSLVKALDGVRFYDTTKVRLVGRVAGGIDQQALRHGLGLGKNNLGDDLQLVLMLEGDNTAHIVRDPDQLDRDTLHFAIDDYSGHTATVYEQKRIIIRPDVTTGEFSADIFPVKYKVVQATANGYATLFPAGTGSETFDLTNAPLTVVCDSLEDRKVSYNAVYDRIYRSPVKVSLVQQLYGMPQDGFGEPSMDVSGFDPKNREKVALYTAQADGTVRYLLGYPLFFYNRRYQFEAQAYEEYFYNNSPSGAVDRVPQRGGEVIIRNGMHSSTDNTAYPLDNEGRNRSIWLTTDHIQTQNYGENALSTVSVALRTEGTVVETDAFRAFVTGDVYQANELTSTDADITLLDIVRDPGGNGSSAWVENGTTYNYSYVENYDWTAGVNVIPKYGLNISNDIGIVTAPAGAGTYIGSNYESSKQISFTIPIIHEFSWGYKYSYTFTTTDRITTSSGKNTQGIGSNADVFLGVTTSQLTGKAKSVGIISDSLFQARQPAIQAGTMHVLASGADKSGRTYYLVTGEKAVLGSAVKHTFAYSQFYVLETVIPQLALQRQNLLMAYPDEETAQAAADAAESEVYWYIDSLTAVSLREPLAEGSYRVIVPSGSNRSYPDRVAAIDNILLKWMNVILMNEKEKVKARQSGQLVGTYSVSSGNTYAHSDSYSATANYNEMPQTSDLALYETKTGLVEIGEDLINTGWDNFKQFFGGDSRYGTTVSDALVELFKDEKNPDGSGAKTTNELGTVTNSSKFKVNFQPVVDFNSTDRMTREKTIKKSAGFTLVPDGQGDITVSVYRANMDSVWVKDTKSILDNVDQGNNDSILYGSYVFFTQAGSTYCMHEAEERTRFYNKGTLLNNPTMALAVPEMSIDRYEVSNVPSDQRAKFRLELKNAGQVPYGMPTSGTTFALSLTGDSNPNGAKVYVNGAPLIQGLTYFMKPGQVISQILEVEKGEGDDFENLTLQFNVDDCLKNWTYLNFSVHFQPESSPVSVAFPRDKWVMNTLSAKDSIGYYLPVTIDGFDIHHRNFDHIEFQYKLSTENDDAWVNQCSFYADDSLYNIATGNKAMIENGRITPFRFYGERDPKELNYDLRAVSFCRYGSGFVTKSSPVISGTKDTRPPVLFGKAQPANGIMTLEDNITLRFSEPIAGNWLDEDNNFQLRGVTNATGITQSTSLYLGGKTGQYLESDAGRELAITDLTVDMMIKPAEKGRDMTLFAHGDSISWLEFLLTEDNRLKVILKDDDKEIVTLRSKQMGELSTTDFTRVLMVYDFWESTVRFYVGTLDITDANETDVTPYMLQNGVAPLRFGKSLFNDETVYNGNMMEVRVWTKPLNPDEISNTHMRRLSGYEYALMDYYPMNEGEGMELLDLASGATLHGSGLSWTNPVGLSVALEGEPVLLKPEHFSRSAAQDYTLMGWFRSDNSVDDRFSFFSTSMTDSVTMEIGYDNGRLFFRQDGVYTGGAAPVTDGEWHHIALSVSKTYDIGTLYLNGKVVQTFAVHDLGGLAGTKVSLGTGLKGNIDDICLFEQALPASLVQECYRSTPYGDEMGLIALLPFSEMKRNAANVMEHVFSPNDRRVFKDANGNVIEKVVPLVLGDIANQKDESNYAPVVDRGQMTNLNFTWTYHDEELLINLKMQDSEINKRTLYLTVRDVEDLNGNRLISPVTWSVYADLNSLRWSTRRVDEKVTDASVDYSFKVSMSNTTGMTRQFTIDNLPEWLDCSSKQGSMEAKDEMPVTFTVRKGLSSGHHNAVVFLTDDKGLSESLVINIEIVSECPWDEIDTRKYRQSMSLRAQVIIGEDGMETIDTDTEDIVGIFCNGELVGKGRVSGEDHTRGYVYVTVYGDASLEGKPLTARLWRHSTAKTHLLSADVPMRFKENGCLGCPPSEPVPLRTSDAMMQAITLDAGWTWTSFYIRPDKNGVINSVMMTDDVFAGNDEIKSPATGNFCRYNDGTMLWQGSLTVFNHKYIHLFHTATEHTIYVPGTALQTGEERTIPLKHGWNVLPYHRLDNRPLRDALAYYYAYAVEGDMVKSHDEFAVFSANGKWEGNLTYMQPGRGYMLYRQGNETVGFVYEGSASEVSGKRRMPSSEDPADALPAPEFHNPEAAANMTVIAGITGLPEDRMNAGKVCVKVFVDDELAAVAAPQEVDGEVLYFLTVQSDRHGRLRFETGDGERLCVMTDDRIAASGISNVPDSHLGSLKAPVLLTTGDADARPVKRVINGILYIFQAGRVYNASGMLIDNPLNEK